MGNKTFRDGQLDNAGQTIGRQHLDGWATNLKVSGQQKLSVMPRIAAEAEDQFRNYWQ